MASFSLRSQRTGQYKEFTLLEVLKLLGDHVNDEIWLQDGEDVFNLSSFQEIGGGSNSGNSAGNWNVEAPVNSSGQSSFLLNYQPSGVLLVILNGIVLSRYKDFLQEGRTIIFPYLLNTQDNLQFIYQF